MSSRLVIHRTGADPNLVLCGLEYMGSETLEADLRSDQVGTVVNVSRFYPMKSELDRFNRLGITYMCVMSENDDEQLESVRAAYEQHVARNNGRTFLVYDRFGTEMAAASIAMLLYEKGSKPFAEMSTIDDIIGYLRSRHATEREHVPMLLSNSSHVDALLRSVCC